MKVGAYELGELLGEGGMGKVYRATHEVLNRPAAVKLVRLELGPESNVEQRAEREAKVISAIRHPNVVEIYDFIVLENPRRIAIVMELLDGRTLRDVLARAGKLPLAEALDVALQVGGALQAMHAAGVVHRDLKPANIMLVPKPPAFSAKLLDFGIAQLIDAQGELTKSGVLLGTPSYMAPEQIEASRATPATDVYALAEVFYEMLSGERAFDTTGLILKQKLMGAMPDLKLLDASASTDRIRALLKRCLVPEPNERPKLSEVLQTLRDLARQQRHHSGRAVITALNKAAVIEPAMIRAPDRTKTQSLRAASIAEPPEKPSRSSWLITGALVAALIGVGVYFRRAPVAPEVAAPQERIVAVAPPQIVQPAPKVVVTEAIIATPPPPPITKPEEKENLADLCAISPEACAPAQVPTSLDREQLDYELKGCANRAAKACFSAAEISYRFGNERVAREMAAKGCEFGFGPSCAFSAGLEARAGAARKARENAIAGCELRSAQACLIAAFLSRDIGNSGEALEYGKAGCSYGSGRACALAGVIAEERGDTADAIQLAKIACTTSVEPGCKQLIVLRVRSDYEAGNVEAAQTLAVDGCARSIDAACQWAARIKCERGNREACVPAR
jgi:eukaryotic-like serine/threonine-protein kinase